MAKGVDLKKRREVIWDESKGSTVDLKNGFFRTIAPMCVSDPFEDKGVFKGTGFRSGFKVGAPRTDSSNNGCFTSLLSLAVGDPYVDKGKVRRKSTMPSGAVKSERPSFRPSGKTKRTQKDLYQYSRASSEMDPATINALVEESRKEKMTARDRMESGPRNFVTNPCRKGGYGYTGTTFSDREGYRHTRFLSGKQFDGTEIERKKKGRMQHLAKIGERKPFCGIGRRPGDSNGYFGKDEETFIHRPVSAPIRRRKPKSENSENERAPFRPGGPLKKGVDPKSFPKWLPDPDTGSGARRRRATSAVDQERPTWKPSSGSQTANVRTVALNRRNIGWKP